MKVHISFLIDIDFRSHWKIHWLVDPLNASIMKAECGNKYLWRAFLTEHNGLNNQYSF